MKKQIKKRIIWSNENIEVDGELRIENPELSEDELLNIVYEDNNQWFDDERKNLDIKLNGSILAIASMGLWNGRVKGYKIIESKNIKDILYSDCDYCTWYCDGYNIKSIQHHHDGTNYIEYREVKSNVDIDILLNDIYNDKEITRARLNYYTKSIAPEVKNIYGW